MMRIEESGNDLGCRTIDVSARSCSFGWQVLLSRTRRLIKTRISRLTRTLIVLFLKQSLLRTLNQKVNESACNHYADYIQKSIASSCRKSKHIPKIDQRRQYGWNCRSIMFGHVHISPKAKMVPAEHKTWKRYDHPQCLTTSGENEWSATTSPLRRQFPTGNEQSIYAWKVSPILLVKCSVQFGFDIYKY